MRSFDPPRTPEEIRAFVSDLHERIELLHDLARQGALAVQPDLFPPRREERDATIEVEVDTLVELARAAAGAEPRDALAMAGKLDDAGHESAAESVRTGVVATLSSPDCRLSVHTLVEVYEDLDYLGWDDRDDLLPAIVRRAADEQYVDVITRDMLADRFHWANYSPEHLRALIAAAAEGGAIGLGMGDFGAEHADLFLRWLRAAARHAYPDPVERLTWLAERLKGVGFMGDNREAISDLVADWIGDALERNDRAEAKRALKAVNTLLRVGLDEDVVENAVQALKEATRGR